MYSDLHIHTEYTHNKGITQIDKLINKASEFNMEYLGIADSGNVSGALEFYERCIEKNIKPIIGCGIYYTFSKRFKKEKSKNHIVLIPKNKEGIKNILKLVILSYEEGFYLKPRIDLELLKKYNKNLILFTGGLGGPIDKMILKEDLNRARDILKYFLNVFSKKDIYLEIQDNGKKENIIATEGLLKLKNEMDVGISTSGGSFYVDSDDKKACNDLRLKNGNNPLKGEYHFKSESELLKSVIIPKKAILNTGSIAKKAYVNLDLDKIKNILNLKEYKEAGNQKRAEIFLDLIK